MSTSIDQQFIEFVVKSLVGNPEAVQVTRSVDEKGVLLELTVDPEDLGRVIGKRGATAQSLRTLLRALGTKNEARYNLKIIDNGVFPDRPSANNDGMPASSPSVDSQASTTPAADDSPKDAPAPKEDQDHQSDIVAKTRAELDELDDLDI